MGKAVLVLINDEIRAKAKDWVGRAPDGTRLTFVGPKRSLPQNDRLHAALTEIASQVTYHGIRLSVDDWKILFLDALNREVRMVPNLDGNGFVSLGRSTSVLSKEDFSGLIDIVQEWAARNGVELSQ